MRFETVRTKKKIRGVSSILVHLLLLASLIRVIQAW